MPSTYLSLHYHVVFSTKDREPLIHESWRDELHNYLGGIVSKKGGQPRGVGGVADHVHLLLDLGSTHCLADLMRELKKSSSMWVSEKTGKPFAWQEGYSAFTVSATAVESVRSYVLNQEGHHRTKSFREELVEFLEKAGVKYDLRCLD